MLFEIDVAKEGVSVAKNFFEAKVNGTTESFSLLLGISFRSLR